MRILRGWRWKGRRAGRWLSAAIVAVCVLEYAVPLGSTWYTGDCPDARQQVARRLESDGQRHLVFVRYDRPHLFSGVGLQPGRYQRLGRGLGPRDLAR